MTSLIPCSSLQVSSQPTSYPC
uniref:Uncharacterized protein n=1 Tax=Rhizophora mucronata TaxID=61149 RepID=A0A2P2PNL8_RHIMU